MTSPSILSHFARLGSPFQFGCSTQLRFDAIDRAPPLGLKTSKLNFTVTLQKKNKKVNCLVVIVSAPKTFDSAFISQISRYLTEVERIEPFCFRVVSQLRNSQIPVIQ